MKKYIIAVLSCVIIACVALFAGGCNDNGAEQNTPQGNDTEYTVTVSACDNGSLTADRESAKPGETVTVTATPDEGYKLGAFYVNSVQSELVFDMPEKDVILFATFIPLPAPVYKITAEDSENGVYTLSATESEAGEYITVQVQPDSGYEFYKLNVGGVDVFGTGFYMPEKDTEVSAYFRKKVIYAESEVTVDCTVYNGSTDTDVKAQSRWFFEYLEEGIKISVQVSDGDVYANKYLGETYYNDNVEFWLCADTDSRTLVQNALKFVIGADGNYIINSVNETATDTGEAVKDIGLVYGDNFYIDVRMTSEQENGYDGYYVSAYIGYELFGLDAASAAGKLVIMPALRNAVYLNGGEIASGWACFDKFGAQWLNASTFILMTVESGFDFRVKQVEYLFFGDSYFDVGYVNGWTTFYEDFAGLDVNNISIAGSKCTEWLEKIDEITAYVASKYVIHIGVNDLNGLLALDRTDFSEDEAAVRTVISNLEKLFGEINEANGAAEIYYVSINKMMINVVNWQYVDEINAAIKEYAEDVGYLTYIDVFSNLSDADGNPIKVVAHEDMYHMSALGYPMYAREIKKAMGLAYSIAGETIGEADAFVSTYGVDASADCGDDPYVAITEGGTQYAYFNGLYSTKFYIETQINVSSVLNGEEYPKFGIMLMSYNEMLSFYIDMTPEMTAEKAGVVVKHGNAAYDWANACGYEIAGMSFSGDDYITLGVLRNESTVYFFVNGTLAISVTDSLLSDENCVAGVFSFNTALTIKNYFIGDSEKFAQMLIVADPTEYKKNGTGIQWSWDDLSDNKFGG